MASTLMARAGSARLPSFRPEPQQPEEPPEEDDSPVEGVELGPLLGRGSYGRVYLGRWNGQEVAIKVWNAVGMLDPCFPHCRVITLQPGVHAGQKRKRLIGLSVP